MKKTYNNTDQNLIRIFKYFSGGVALVFILFLMIPAPLAAGDPVSRRAMLLFFITYTFIFIYLTIPRLEERLKSWFLPPVLAAASLIPIAIINAKYRALLNAGIPINTLDDTMTVTILLIFPLITTAWNYRYPIVFLFFVVLGLLDPLLIFLVNGGITEEIFGAFNASLIRIPALAAVGFMITELRNHQRQEQKMLEEANRKLQEYAHASERLAVSRERNRIARDMHDTLAHTLSGLAIQLEAVDTIIKPDNTNLKNMIDTARQTIRTGLHETRRTLKALRASPLEDLGLFQAVAQLAKDAGERGNVQIQTELPENTPDWDDNLEENVYRIAQEALENIVRHSHAREALIKLEGSSESLTLYVEDNGRGFNADQPSFDDRYGLWGIKERSAALGGTVQINSRPGKGTQILFEWKKEHD